MSKSNVFENDLLKLIFNGVAIPNLADNAAGAPLTELYLALHTADPGEDGNQTTNEVGYDGYSRVAVERNSSGWTITDNSVSPTVAIEFGEMIGGTPGFATHVSIGTLSSGEGKILYSGSLTPSVNYNIGLIVRLRTTSTITED